MEAKAAFDFNDEHITLALPVPFGGYILHVLILDIYIPEAIPVFVPLFDKAEVSTKVHSNLYDLEASASAGKDAVVEPSYSARFDVTGSSPVDILSIKIKGSGLLARTPDDSIKAQLMSSVTHTLIDASISIMEVATVTDKFSVKSSSKIEATSPLGLHVAVEHTGLVGFSAEEVSAESNLEGTVEAGLVFGNTIATQSFVIFPFRPEANFQSSLKIASTLLQAQNTIGATFSNGELSVLSNTNAFNDLLKQDAKLTFKDNQLSLKVNVDGLTIHSQAEASAGAEAVTLRMRISADGTQNSIDYRIGAFLETDGLAVNSDADVMLYPYEATHKATLTKKKDGLAISAKTNLQGPMTAENTITAGLDASEATLSINSKAALEDLMVDNVNSLTITLSSLDFNGILKAAYNEEEIKHTYEINYADLTASAKCSTTGKLLGTHMSHNTELEVIGLAARIHNDARFNSQLLRFDHTIRASVIPFDFNLDAIFNADGDLTLYGRQSGQLYGKFLLKAQPLALASSHEYRASVTQQMDNGFSLETTVDNKVDTLITPQEQKATFRLKSKVNDHALNQEVSAYNNAERLGLEVSGTLLTDLLNNEASAAQEFTISSFLRYDKNTNSHMIQLPLIQSLPAMLETIKIVVVSMAEALQNYINNEDIKAKFEALPQQLSDFVTQLNLEGKAVQLKQYLIDFTQEHAITIEELEDSLVNLRIAIEKLITGLASHIQGVIDITKEMIVSGTLSKTVIHRINQELNAISEEYDISHLIVSVIDAINVLIKQIDIDIEIKAKLEQAVSDMKQFVENFDRTRFVEDLKNYISSINLEAHIGELMARIPTDTINIIIDSVKRVNQELDIIGKFNAFPRKLKELIVKLNIDKKFEAILEKGLELIQQFKIDEAFQVLANKLQSINIPAKVMQMLEEAINYLRDTDMKQVIVHMNEYLDSVVQKIESFNYNDYNHYVDEVNHMITYLNEVVKALEIQKKFEATREFYNFVLSSVMSSIKQLRENKVADMIRSVKDFVDFAILNDVKAISTSLGQKIYEMDVEVEIPEFTILGLHTVRAQTYHLDSIKHVFLRILYVISHFEIQMSTVDAFFGDLKMNYLLTLPAIRLPEITLPEIFFPAFPTVIAEKLLEIPTLQIPEFKLPISSEVLVPCFGKLYGELKVNTPIYSLKTSAELQNATTNAKTPQFTASLTSKATSRSFEILSYNLDSTARIAIPKLSRVIVAETLKFTHSAIAVDHQGSFSLYGLSAQASAKTTVKATTAPYTANIVSNAFFAKEDGILATLDTTYNHQINIPTISFTSEASLTQKAVFRQEDVTVTVNIGNDGSGKFGSPRKGTHKSDLQFSINPSTIKLTCSGDTDFPMMKMKQVLSVDGVVLSYIKFDARSEAEGPAIKNSLVVASGHANLGDMKLELKANHDTEFVGEVSGVLSNAINVLIHPAEVVFDFHNKGTTKLSLPDTLVAKIDLQNDYSATIKPDVQKINTMAFARFNEYKYSHNFTIDNNDKEASIYAAVDGEADIDILNKPITFPDPMDLLMGSTHIDTFNLNLYNFIGMNDIFTTPEQNVAVDAKIVYQKSNSAPILNLGLIRIPSLGNLITELAFKSSIFNLNANTGLNAEDDLVFRLGVTTASVFEALKAKLDGTTSLTTRRGLKLATALTLENPHIEGSLDSSIRLDPDNTEADVSVSNALNIKLLCDKYCENTLPVLSFEVTQKFVVDTNDKLNSASTLKLKGDFNLPIINAVGQAEADHSLKLDGNLDYISMETFTKGKLDGTILETYPVLAALDNEANIYLNADVLRSTSKIIANAILSHSNTKILEIDVDESLAVEASLRHVSVVLKFTSNNDANWRTFTSTGKHVAQATMNLAPTSLSANVEIDMSQPSSLGDIVIFEKTIVDLSASKQTISSTAKIATPVYTTNLAVEVEGDVPDLKVTVKASATSIIVFLGYDMDGSISLTENEDDILSMTGKFILTHPDLSVDIQEVLTAPLRKKRQAEGSVSRHTLNMDITSPTFTDVNFRYASRNDGFSASISTPSTGFLALQFQGRTLSQLNARLYNRYASAPEDDVEILIIRTSVKDAEEMTLQVAYNMEAPIDMLEGLKERVPAITSTLTNFGDKYEITKFISGLSSAIIAIIDKGRFNKMELFIKGVLDQKVVLFLDDVDMFLKETQFMLPGTDDMTTLPELLKEIRETFEEEFEDFSEMFDITDMVWTTLEVYSITLFHDVDTVDNIKEGIVVLNQRIVDLGKDLLGQISTLNMEQLSSAIEYIMDMAMSAVFQFKHQIVSKSFLYSPYLKVREGRLEMELPLPFH